MYVFSWAHHPKVKHERQTIVISTKRSAVTLRLYIKYFPGGQPRQAYNIQQREQQREQQQEQQQEQQIPKQH